MTTAFDSAPVWFITGASSGFGLALARAAARRGARVAGTARDPARLAPLADEFGAAFLPLALELGEPAAVPAVVAQAQAHWGRLDVVVNNAGAATLGAIEEHQPGEIDRCLAVNFHGPLAVMRAVAPAFREQRGGHLLNISAAAAVANYPGFGLYGAAKAALEFAAESYRAELASFGVKVTLVQPGPFRTGFLRHQVTSCATTLPAYENTVRRFGRTLERLDGRQPGDPERAADLLVELVFRGEAPLRLPLGAYAVKKTRDGLAARNRELETWAERAAATDFPPVS